jgi:uncharacterized protein YecE (DUF72 family)
MAELKIGTCSWKYDSWRGIVYSDSPDLNYLKEYSEHFDTVEIDQWFWSLFDTSISLPRKEDVLMYKQSVPRNFTFTIKVPNSITLTHYQNKDKTIPIKKNPHFLSSEVFMEFIEVLTPLHKQIGFLMFQFEYLNKQKMPSLQAFESQFLSFYEKLPVHNLQLAVEIRNPNYLSPSFFSFLNELQLTPVFLEGYFMPPVTETYNRYKGLIKNSAIIRLHGPDRSGIEKISGGNWNQLYIDRHKELQTIRDMIVNMQNRDINLYINVNNHFEGCAPFTINRLRQLLTEAKKA